MTNILLVEDDKKTADFIKSGLTEEGFFVHHAVDGRTGLDLGLEGTCDAAIVDIMLPGLDGLSLVEQLRSAGSSMPILFLSGRKTVEDRLSGFKAGGDDYLVKPFSFAELVARLLAILRRSQPVSEQSLLTAANLELDLLSRKVFRGGLEIELQQREFALLSYLLQHKGRVISKMMILEQVWGYDFDPQTNVVEACVCRLRDKVDNKKQQHLIHTVRGVGYVLDEKR
jgi:two-component system OmpR family response regulator